MSRDIATAALRFRLGPERAEWIYATLMNQPQVKLYEGEFPDPFTNLTYVAAHMQNQLVLATVLGVGSDFTARYGVTVGTPDDLQPLIRRYHKGEFYDNNQRLVLYRDGQAHGVIGRAEDKIVIQRGGTAGQLLLSKNAPVNDLAVHLNQYNLLVQRYVSAVWNASPETDQMKLQLTLDIPQLPDGALETYFSTFELMGKRFREHSRPVNLDEDIGGHPSMKALIKSLFMDLTQPDVSRSFGTQPFSNKFVLVTGEEGTGKTLFVKALDYMLRTKYGDRYEHFRLPLGDMMAQYGPATATIVKTILDHARENEKNGVPTLLHLDNLEQLVPPHQRSKSRTNLLFTPSGELMPTQSQVVQVPSDAEFAYSLQIVNPVAVVFREFSREIGGDVHHLIMYGESRLSREELPEGIARTFRRAFSLYPTAQDLADILRVQIRYTRHLAEKTSHDPLVPDIESHLDEIAQCARGLNGRDIQQALLNITMKLKAEWDGQNYRQITAEDLSDALKMRLAEKGIEYQPKPRIGFHTTR